MAKLAQMLEYLKRLRLHLFTASFIFMIGYIVGAVLIIGYNEDPLGFTKTIGSSYTAAFFSLPPGLLTLGIFLNNGIKVFMAVALGIVIGFYPTLLLLVNGFIVGSVVTVGGMTIGWDKTLAGILPHGLIELPVFIIGGAIGLMLGAKVIDKIFKKNKTPIKPEFYKAIGFTVKVLIPLLFIAAIIESFITPFAMLTV